MQSHCKSNNDSSNTEMQKNRSTTKAGENGDADQAAAVRALLRDWHGVESWRDLAGIERVTGGVYRV